MHQHQVIFAPCALVEKTMNDSFSGKNGKVKVMYVRSDDDNGDDRNKNKRPAGKGRPADGARSGRTGQDIVHGQRSPWAPPPPQ